MALSRVKKIGLISTGVILVGLLGYFSFTYYSSYSTGTRAGVVMKISKKGYIFKTYEGQLNLGVNQDPWDFSVDTNRQDVVKALEDAQNNNDHVTLHYEEKFVQYAWRGDTKYFITKVERKQ